MKNTHACFTTFLCLLDSIFCHDGTFFSQYDERSIVKTFNYYYLIIIINIYVDDWRLTVML